MSVAVFTMGRRPLAAAGPAFRYARRARIAPSRPAWLTRADLYGEPAQHDSPGPDTCPEKGASAWQTASLFAALASTT